MRTTPIKRLTSLIAVTALAGVGLTLATSTAAHADTISSCTGQVLASWNPGLTNTAQNELVYVYGDYLACVVNGTAEQVTTHLTNVSYSNVSCTSLATSGSGDLTIYYPDGSTSHASVSTTISLNLLGEVVQVASGTIDTGSYVGSTVTETNVLANLSTTACASSNGVQGESGESVLVMT